MNILLPVRHVLRNNAVAVWCRSNCRVWHRALLSIFACFSMEVGCDEQLSTYHALLVDELIENGRVHDVIELVKSGHIAPSSKFSKISLLEMAIIENELELAKMLVTDHWLEVEQYAMRSLLFACTNGEVEVVKMFLQKGVDADTKLDDRGSSCAFMALERLDVEVIAALKEHGADLGGKNPDGLTARQIIEYKQEQAEKIKSLFQK